MRAGVWAPAVTLGGGGRTREVRVGTHLPRALRHGAPRARSHRPAGAPDIAGGALLAQRRPDKRFAGPAR